MCSTAEAPGKVQGNGGYYMCTYGILNAAGGTIISTVSGYPGANDAHSVGIFGTPLALYGSDSSLDPNYQGMFHIGATTGLPVTSQTTATGILPGTTSTNYDPWIFVWQSPTSLWVADTGEYANPDLPSRYNVVNFQLQGPTWVPAPQMVFFESSPIRSIAGRNEGGFWSIYAVSPTTLYRYSTFDGSVTAMASAGPGALFRGVAPAPVSAAMHPANPLPTWSPTNTPSASVTPSASATASATNTASPSLSSGASPSTSATSSITATPTLTSTATPTPTASATTASATLTSTPTSTQSPTTSQTSSQTASVTGSRHAEVFQPDSVLVVRVGNSTYAAGTIANGVSLPVFIDEYSPWAPGGAYSTLALPAFCALATGLKPTVSPYIWHDTSGFPSLANDQSVIALPCWRLPFGTTITDTTAVIKTVMLVRADGSFDASTTMTWPYAGSLGNPISMHNVAMNTYSNPGPPSGIYVAFGGGCE